MSAEQPETTSLPSSSPVSGSSLATVIEKKNSLAETSAILPDTLIQPPEDNFATYEAACQQLSNSLTTITAKILSDPSEKNFNDFIEICREYNLFRWKTQSKKISKEDKIRAAYSSAQRILKYYLFAWLPPTIELSDEKQKRAKSAGELKREIQSKLLPLLKKFAAYEAQKQDEKKTSPLISDIPEVYNNVIKAAEAFKSFLQEALQAKFKKNPPRIKDIKDNLAVLYHELLTACANAGFLTLTPNQREHWTFIEIIAIHIDMIQPQKPYLDLVKKSAQEVISIYSNRENFFNSIALGVAVSNLIPSIHQWKIIISESIEKVEKILHSTDDNLSSRKEEIIRIQQTGTELLESLLLHCQKEGFFNTLSYTLPLSNQADLQTLDINQDIIKTLLTAILKNNDTAPELITFYTQIIEILEKYLLLASLNSDDLELDHKLTIREESKGPLLKLDLSVSDPLSSHSSALTGSTSIPAVPEQLPHSGASATSLTPVTTSTPELSSPLNPPSTLSISSSDNQMSTPPSLPHLFPTPPPKILFKPIETKENKRPSGVKHYPTLAELENVLTAEKRLNQKLSDIEKDQRGVAAKSDWNLYLTDFLKACNAAEIDVVQQTFLVFAGLDAEEYLYDLLDRYHITLPANYWGGSKTINKNGKIEIFAANCFADLLKECNRAGITLLECPDYAAIESNFKSIQAAITKFIAAEKEKETPHAALESIKELIKTLSLIIKIQGSTFTTLVQCKMYFQKILAVESAQKLLASKTVKLDEAARNYPTFLQVSAIREAQKKLLSNFLTIKEGDEPTIEAWKENFKSFLFLCDRTRIDILPEAREILVSYEIFFTDFLNTNTPKEIKEKNTRKNDILTMMFHCCNDLLSIIAFDPPKVTDYAAVVKAYKEIKGKISPKHSTQANHLFNTLTILYELHKQIPLTLKSGHKALEHIIDRYKSIAPKAYPTSAQLAEAESKLPRFAITIPYGNDTLSAEDAWKKGLHLLALHCRSVGIDIRPQYKATFKNQPNLLSVFLEHPLPQRQHSGITKTSLLPSDIKAESTGTYDIDTMIYDCSNALMQSMNLPGINFENFSHFQSTYEKIQSAAERFTKEDLHDEVAQTSQLLGTLNSLISLRNTIIERLEASLTAFKRIDAIQHGPLEGDDSNENKQRVIRVISPKPAVSPTSPSSNNLIMTSLQPTSPVSEQPNKLIKNFYKALFAKIDNPLKCSEMLAEKDNHFLTNVLKHAVMEHHEKITGLIYNYLEEIYKKSDKKMSRQENIKLVTFKADMLIHAQAILKKDSGNGAALNIVSVCKPPKASLRMSPSSPITQSSSGPSTPLKKADTDSVTHMNSFPTPGGTT